MAGTPLDTGHVLLYGQGLSQIGCLLLAFVLSSLVGLERQLHHKSAGLRTQAIVGTASALFLLVGKYGFADVVVPYAINEDPSRVAAQVVSGIGFLGAGIILTRRGAVRGLTAAAAVWESAAIGMGAGGGLWLLAVIVTGLHFVVAYGYTALAHRLGAGPHSHIQLTVGYRDGQGILRQVLTLATEANWTVTRFTLRDPVIDDDGQRVVQVALDVHGSMNPDELVRQLGEAQGATYVSVGDDSDDG